MNMIEYSYILPQEGNYEEIFEHLCKMDESYAVKLSKRINLSLYARKIINNATIFTARDNGKLIGVVAIYLKINELSFCTDVSLLPEYHGKEGIGKKILCYAIDYIKENGGCGISLVADLGLKKYYETLGFEERESIYKIADNETYLVLEFDEGEATAETFSGHN